MYISIDAFQQSIMKASIQIMQSIKIQLLTSQANKLNWCAIAQQFKMHCLDEQEHYTDVVVFDPTCYAWDDLSVFQNNNAELYIVPIVHQQDQHHVRSSLSHRAFDLLFYPVTDNDFAYMMQKIYTHRLHQEEIQQDRLLLKDKPIGVSLAFKQVLKKIEHVADTYLPVLLTGETGTGKGAIAKYLHQLSQRSEHSFHIVNCGAIAPGVLESELFGHEKGAFSGAVSRRIGLFEYMNGGTILLDEINSATPELQVRLLDFIQEGTIKRVGSNQAISVDVRLVFATNQQLPTLVMNGNFREDLYYRMNVYPVDIPSLKNRREDIAVLAAKFMGDYAQRLGISDVKACAPNVLQTMIDYDWPGNVRQLENTIQRLLISAKGRRIELSDLPSEMRMKMPKAPKNWLFTKVDNNEKLTLKELEQRYINHTLTQCDGNKSVAAKYLGINTTTLWRKLKELSDE